MSPQQRQTLLQTTVFWQVVFSQFLGTIDNDSLLQFFLLTFVILPKVIHFRPLTGAAIYFTDNSSKQRATIWSFSLQHSFSMKKELAQHSEIKAILYLLEQFTDQPLNMLSNSSYTVYLTQKIEATSIHSAIEPPLL